MVDIRDFFAMELWFPSMELFRPFYNIFWKISHWETDIQLWLYYFTQGLFNNQISFSFSFLLSLFGSNIKKNLAWILWGKFFKFSCYLLKIKNLLSISYYKQESERFIYFMVSVKSLLIYYEFNKGFLKTPMYVSNF